MPERRTGATGQPDVEELQEPRARYPGLIAARAAERRRRPLLRSDGRLMIGAACALVRDLAVTS